MAMWEVLLENSPRGYNKQNHNSMNNPLQCAKAQLRDPHITLKYLQVGKEKQTEGEERGSEDTDCVWVTAWSSAAGRGRMKKAVDEHQGPQVVYGTEKKRSRGWDCETPQPDLMLTPRNAGTGTARLHSLTSL